MNKFGIVLGAAAFVTLAGCKDPNYKYPTPESSSQGEVKNVETVPTTVTTIEPAPAPTCKCLPGTKHSSPCVCGAPDCKCVVETKPAPAVAAPAPAAAESAVTEYVVQEGDYLAKISKRYNVTLAAIRRLNPSIKKDLIRVGQKIKLPSTVDVGVQKAPASASSKAPAAAKTAKPVKKSGVAAPYTGATKEYVVKNGDTLGSVAYGNGLNIRQLKQLNGLTKDTLKVGQKLKIPAEKVAHADAKKESAPLQETKAETATPAAAASAAGAAAPVPVAEEKKSETPAAETPTPAPAPAPAAPATMTYVVKEGDDMTGVSIRWGVSAAEIRELNNLGENDQLVPGQIIKLPAEAQQ